MNSLQLLSSDDQLFDENYNKILAKTKNIKDTILEPTLEEKKAIYNIVMKFIKIKKRKIYGGFALNKLLVNKNKEDAIYDEDIDEPDIDFYSPEPIKDLIEICNLIHDAGYSNIWGKEALHVGTYKIHVNWNKECCDITYVPNNIYKKIRFIEIDGYYYTHAWFIMIDYMRAMTDLMSDRNLSKYRTRFIKLEKAYPLPYVDKILKLDSYKNKNIKECMNDLFENFLITRDTLIFSGFYVYNYYLNVSKIGGEYKYTNIPYYEIYSINYINDGLDLIEYIKTLDCVVNIEYEEFYPLFQYFGNSTVFYFTDGKNKHPILYLYNNNKRCIPYKNVQAKLFDNNNVIDLKNNINIGSYHYNILHILILLLKVRVDDDNDMNDKLYTELNGIIKFRKHYFKTENKNENDDDTIFESFSITCLGRPLDAMREKRIRTNIRYKMKKPTEYKYDPEKNKNKIPNYNQPNTSGSKILNKKHLQLIESKRYFNKEDIIKDEEENGENEYSEKE